MLAQKGMKDPEEIGAASSDYLKLFAHTAMAFLWARSAKVALEKLADDATEDKGYYAAKLHTARFFMQRMPEAVAAAKMIQAGKDSLMDMPKICSWRPNQQPHMIDKKRPGSDARPFCYLRLLRSKTQYGSNLRPPCGSAGCFWRRLLSNSEIKNASSRLWVAFSRGST